MFQPIRRLLDRPKCFRLGRASPGGTCTHGFNVPWQGTHNNVCERAIKKAILHRKSAYFYKTENGAHVGDLFMSLIHTCQLNGANPFHYLTELQKHASELAVGPADWMPWNYLATLESGQGCHGG